MGVWSQYLSEYLRNARHCSYCMGILCTAAILICLFVEGRLFYLLTAIQPAFLFPCETSFLSEAGEVLMSENEITF